MITRLPCAKHSLGASMLAKAIAISTVPTWVSVLRHIGRWVPSHRCSRARMWSWFRRFSARGQHRLASSTSRHHECPPVSQGASRVQWLPACLGARSARSGWGLVTIAGNWCDDAEAGGSPDHRWMAPPPGLPMREQCPVLSTLPAVQGCMLSRDHLGRGAFVYEVEKRDEAKLEHLQ